MSTRPGSRGLQLHRLDTPTGEGEEEESATNNSTLGEEVVQEMVVDFGAGFEVTQVKTGHRATVEGGPLTAGHRVTTGRVSRVVQTLDSIQHPRTYQAVQRVTKAQGSAWVPG